MKIRFQADADLNEDIVSGVVRSEPSIDFQRAEEANLTGLDDLSVLAVAAKDGRALVTHWIGDRGLHLFLSKDRNGIVLALRDKHLETHRHPQPTGGEHRPRPQKTHRAARIFFDHEMVAVPLPARCLRADIGSGYKAFVEVNEQGTEAAVTSTEIWVTSMPLQKKTFQMVVNRPFFFVMRDNASGALLFMGSVVAP